ncbi:hypothetical protein R6Q59_003541 [Mikania micrantha]
MKAKDMAKWSVGEWLFFVEQACILKIDMTYAVEDVEEEDNCMCDALGSWIWFGLLKTHWHHSFFGLMVSSSGCLFGCFPLLDFLLVVQRLGSSDLERE